METITMDDEALVDRIAYEDEAALATLYERHREHLVSYLTLFTRDQGKIEEAIQDTMLAVWKGAPGFSGRSSARSWVFSIARKRLIDALRRKRLPLASDDHLLNHPDPSPSPEHLALGKSGQEDIVSAIRRLSTVHQETLVLTFVHELSYQEIANVLNVPTGTVKSRLSNARKALRDELGKMTP